MMGITILGIHESVAITKLLVGDMPNGQNVADLRTKVTYGRKHLANNK